MEISVAPPRLLTPVKEPTKAYEAFVVYYELGEARSVQKVAEKLGKGEQNVRKFKNKWWWDERIGEYAEWEKGIYRAALEKKASQMAEKILALRTEMIDAQVKLIQGLQERAALINSLPLTERTVTHESPDGKIQHITIKPVNVRVESAGRIALMADALLRSLGKQTSEEPSRKQNDKCRSSTLKRDLPPLTVEIFYDLGDGTRGKFRDLPPPDIYDPSIGMADDEEAELELPTGTIPLA